MPDDNNPFEQQRAAIIKAHILCGYPSEKAELIADLSIRTAAAAFDIVEMGCEAAGSISLTLSVATTTMQMIADHAADFVEAMKADPKRHVLAALMYAHKDAVERGNAEDAEYWEQCLTKARSPDFDVTMTQAFTGPEDASTKH